jgi:TctA family transporter
MPAPAGNGQVIDEHASAVGTAILAALLDRAVATRMLAFVGVLFGHKSLLASLADQFDLGCFVFIPIRSISNGSLLRFFSDRVSSQTHRVSPACM